jgi:NAD(P)H-dependent FMN reductase
MNYIIKLKIILGSIRQNRFGEKPAYWIYEEAKKNKELDPEILDLRDYPFGFFENLSNDDEFVKKWKEKINEADAFIMIVPEYNHGYPAVLKNALDVIYTEWNRKPVGFLSYGGVSGARAVEQMRQVTIGLQMVPIKNAIHIPTSIYVDITNGKIKDNFNEVFNSIRNGSFGDPVDRFFKDLIWCAKTLKYGRENYDFNLYSNSK